MEDPSARGSDQFKQVGQASLGALEQKNYTKSLTALLWFVPLDVGPFHSDRFRRGV
jgi:hypothetical protein